MKDCITCKYGYEDERLGIPMCHHPKRFSEDCIDFNMHEEKHLEGKSDKSLEAEITSFFNNFLGLEMINWDWHCDTLTMASDAIRTFAKHFFELGKKDMKEEMLKDAVEATVKEDAGGYPYIDMDIPLAKRGDKVRIVVLKNNEDESK